MTVIWNRICRNNRYFRTVKETDAHETKSIAKLEFPSEPSTSKHHHELVALLVVQAFNSAAGKNRAITEQNMDFRTTSLHFRVRNVQTMVQ